MKNLAAILFILLFVSCHKENIDSQETVIDVEGNIYKTVKIGDHIWMAENLKVTKYNDGTPIPNVTSISSWSNQLSGAYCWYDNIESYKFKYGALYNWTSVNTGKLAPKGWHVPTLDEFMTLNNFSNVIAFNAVMGGGRGVPVSHGKPTYTFQHIELRGYWWTSTNSPYGQTGGNYFQVDNDNYYNYSYGFPQPGYSVRCVKDN